MPPALSTFGKGGNQPRALLRWGPVAMSMILVAEDNSADVFLVRHALETLQVDARLHIVEDGDLAYQYVEQLDLDDSVPCPGLVLLDLNLPKRSGEEVLGRLRKSPRCAKVPVVMMTSSNSPRDRAEAENLGASYYFRKPSNLDEFMKIGQVVKDLLRTAN